MALTKFESEIKQFLIDEVIYLDKTGGISKVDHLTREDLADYEKILVTFSDLDYYVLRNGNEYDLFLRYRGDDRHIKVGEVVRAAYKDYESHNYKNCIKSIREVLRKAAAPKSEVYGIIGLAYKDLGEMDLCSDYLRLTNYLMGEKDYNNIDVERIRERVEEKMKKGKKNTYNQFNYQSDRQIHIDKLNLPNFDDILAFMEEHKVDIETAGRMLQLTNEEIDIIKLVFAREFYKQGDMDKGDYYLNAVETTSGKTSEVTRLCLEARTNKKFFKFRDNNVPRKLALIRPGKRKK